MPLQNFLDIAQSYFSGPLVTIPVWPRVAVEDCYQVDIVDRITLSPSGI